MDYYVDHDMGLPGGDSFYDVTQTFTDAAAGKALHDSLYCLSFTSGIQDMPSGGLVLAKDFTLQDSMAAFEVGRTFLGRASLLRYRTQKDWRTAVR